MQGKVLKPGVADRASVDDTQPEPPTESIFVHIPASMHLKSKFLMLLLCIPPRRRRNWRNRRNSGWQGSLRLTVGRPQIFSTFLGHQICWLHAMSVCPSVSVYVWRQISYHQLSTNYPCPRAVTRMWKMTPVFTGVKNDNRVGKGRVGCRDAPIV